MVLLSHDKNHTEKVTIILPKVLKDEVMQLKESLQVSMNSIYQMAIAEYIAKKKREQLRKEALMMVEEYHSNPELLELMEFQEDIDEY
jgi:pantoate kinase